jgi:hypothetical protein
LIVAVNPDGKATPLTDITDRVTAAAASLTVLGVPGDVLHARKSGVVARRRRFCLVP